jgi:Mg-chelatase subunit ChlD
MFFEQMVKNFKNAEKLFGQTMIRELTGYDSKYIDKNAKIPEFQRELKKRIKDKIDELKEKGLVKESGLITTDGLDTAALFLINEEFEKTKNSISSMGEHISSASSNIGDKSDVRLYKKGDKYRDLAVKATITRAIKRGHNKIQDVDLHTYEREDRQKVNIIYAIDASGSMRGEKLGLAKKSGVSLANKAIRDSNKIGLIVFGSEIDSKVHLTNNFYSFVKPLTRVTPGQETDIALAIEKSIELLHNANGIKHIVLLTDGIHTTSQDPEKEVLTQVYKASQEGITISVVGIELDKNGLSLAQKIVDNSKGNLYSVKNLNDMQGVIIADYSYINQI